MNHEWKVRLARLAVVALLLALLEVAPRAGWVDPITLIPLSRIVAGTWELAASGRLTPHFVATATNVLISLVLAVVTGFALGIVLWRSRRLWAVLEPYLATYYAVPFFAFYPLLIVLFGMNRLPMIVIAWAFAVVAMAVNTALGFSRVREAYVKVGRSLGLTPWRMLRHIYLPSAVPYVFTGLKLSVSYSVIGIVASEFILSTQGLGWLVSFSYNFFDLTGMYAAITLILVLVIVLNGLLLWWEGRLYRREV
ncbi:MAG TPA: ABC transporter permease [Limnochordales bacterium]